MAESPATNVIRMMKSMSKTQNERERNNSTERWLAIDQHTITHSLLEAARHCELGSWSVSVWYRIM